MHRVAEMNTDLEFCEMWKVSIVPWSQAHQGALFAISGAGATSQHGGTVGRGGEEWGLTGRLNAGSFLRLS